MMLVSKKHGKIIAFSELADGDTFQLPEDEDKVFRIKTQGTGCGPQGPVPRMITMPGGWVGNLPAATLVIPVDLDVTIADRR